MLRVYSVVAVRARTLTLAGHYKMMIHSTHEQALGSMSDGRLDLLQTFNIPPATCNGNHSPLENVPPIIFQTVFKAREPAQAGGGAEARGC